MRNEHIYLNGRIVPASDAAISPFDIGLLRGYAVFDLLRTVDGEPFLLSEHLERLHASADHLGLRVPVTDAEIEAAIRELLRLNQHGEATIRLVLTGGVSPDGMSFDPEKPTFFILTHELHEPPAAVYENGASLVTHDYKREIPKAKTTNYLTMLANKSQAQSQGALDLLYVDDGVVYEAATASVYFVKGRTILAPSDDVLWGTIGSLVLDAAAGDYDVVSGVVSIQDMREADEVFLTSTTRGVVPIVRIDDVPVGDGRVGPVVRDLMERFRASLR